jgi:hypothetical protein
LRCGRHKAAKKLAIFSMRGNCESSTLVIPAAPPPARWIFGFCVLDLTKV